MKKDKSAHLDCTRLIRKMGVDTIVVSPLFVARLVPNNFQICFSAWSWVDRRPGRDPRHPKLLAPNINWPRECPRPGREWPKGMPTAGPKRTVSVIWCGMRVVLTRQTQGNHTMKANTTPQIFDRPFLKKGDGLMGSPHSVTSPGGHRPSIF